MAPNVPPYDSYSARACCNGPLEAMEWILKQQTAPSETAAVIVEPILGEGGFLTPPPAFLPGLRKLCDKHGLLLILDEARPRAAARSRAAGCARRVMHAHAAAARELAHPQLAVVSSCASTRGLGLKFSGETDRSSNHCSAPRVGRSACAALPSAAHAGGAQVQSGVGRTGKWWGHQHLLADDAQPDIMTFAKGIAAGFPFAGLAMKDHVHEGLAPGTMGGTYGGGPLACAAAVATLDVIEGEGLLENAEARGRQLTAVRRPPRARGPRSAAPPLPTRAARGSHGLPTHPAVLACRRACSAWQVSDQPGFWLRWAAGAAGPAGPGAALPNHRRARARPDGGGRVWRAWRRAQGAVWPGRQDHQGLRQAQHDPAQRRCAQPRFA